MTRLAWDEVGSRRYEAGVDRGVLYLADGSGVVWNGLTSVEEQLDDGSTPYFVDGIKYLDRSTPGEFEAKLSAFTYPDEFEQFDGVGAYGNGLFVNDQKPRMFGLAYRTGIGDDLSGLDSGYKIHILYNVVAVAEESTYATASDSTSPVEFTWNLHTTPMLVEGHRPTAHVVVDSTRMNQRLLQVIEDILYGTPTTDPRLPTLAELTALAMSWMIEITDNGDGTWTATAPDEYIRMLTPTMFEIVDVNAVFVSDDEYEVSTTPLS